MCRLTRIVKKNLCAPKIEIRASNRFKTLYLSCLHRKHTRIMYKMGVVNGGILKPVVAKPCRSDLIPLQDFFFSMNELVNIFENSLVDNNFQKPRGSWAFLKFTYNIVHFWKWSRKQILLNKELCPLNDENDFTVLYRRSTGGDAGVCRESNVRAQVPPEGDPAGHFNPSLT